MLAVKTDTDPVACYPTQLGGVSGFEFLAHIDTSL